MSSYVARTNDISVVVHKMEEIAKREGGTVKYAPEMLDVLGRPENRRIKFFYYCDNHQGITVRLYDRKLVEQHPEIICESPRVILRGKGLGEYKGDAKHAQSADWVAVFAIRLAVRWSSRRFQRKELPRVRTG
jgi:hypothetical protein